MDRTDPLQRCVHLLLLLAILGHHTTAYNPPASMDDAQVDSEDSLRTDDLEELKRSSAFYPLRGKKSPLLDPEEDLLKRSQFYPLRGKKGSYFMPMRGRKSEEEEEDLEKRMSSFMPMRGKKSIRSILMQNKPGTYPPILPLRSSPPTNSNSSEERSSFAVPPHQQERGRTEDREERSSFAAPPPHQHEEERGGTEDRGQQREERGYYGGRTDGRQHEERRFGGEEERSGVNSHQKGKEEQRRFYGRRMMEDRGQEERSGFEDPGKEERQRYQGRMDQRLNSDTLQQDGKEDQQEERSGFDVEGRKIDPNANQIEDQSMLNDMQGRNELINNGLGLNAMRRRLEDVVLDGRGTDEDPLRMDEETKRAMGFVPMRGRRFGLGSSLMARHWLGSSILRSAPRTVKVDWDSVKRGFHATRGKRMDYRWKRSLLRNRSHYTLALKRPMSFFATRGKRMDSSAPQRR